MGNDRCKLATFLIVLASSVAARPAPTVEFNCAKAFLKVDFVICRSAEGMKAIGELQAAWRFRLTQLLRPIAKRCS